MAWSAGRTWLAPQCTTTGSTCAGDQLSVGWTELTSACQRLRSSFARFGGQPNGWPCTTGWLEEGDS